MSAVFDRHERWSILPTPRELAEEVALGATVEQLADYYSHRASTIATRIRDGGYSSHTGLPTQKDEPAPTHVDLSRGDLGWQADALCSQTDPEAFYPKKGQPTKAAKAVCHQCPVTEPCLEYALVNKERDGIWGGLSERERRKLTKGRVA